MPRARALAVAALLAAGALLVPAAHAEQCRALMLSTGQFAIGYPDPLWVVTRPGQSAPIPAASVNRPSTSYVTPIAPSKWVASSGLQSGNSAATAPVGTFVYETRFVLPSDTTYAALHGDFAVDNDVTITLNGVTVGGYSGVGNDASAWNVYHPLYVANGSVPIGQLVTLQARVVNRAAREVWTFHGWLYFCTPN